MLDNMVGHNAEILAEVLQLGIGNHWRKSTRLMQSVIDSNLDLVARNQVAAFTQQVAQALVFNEQPLLGSRHLVFRKREYHERAM